MVELCYARVLSRLLFNICKHDITGYFKGEVGTSPAILEAPKQVFSANTLSFFLTLIKWFYVLTNRKLS